MVGAATLTPKKTIERRLDDRYSDRGSERVVWTDQGRYADEGMV